MHGTFQLRSLLTAAAVILALLELSPVHAQDKKPDPAWNKEGARIDEVPSAFPEIKPIDDQKEIEAFFKERTPVVLESDSTLRKLQKAKLRNLLRSVVVELNTRPAHLDFTLDELRLLQLHNLIREALRSGLDQAENDKERRAWLVFAVGIWKSQESVQIKRVEVGASMPINALNAQRSRLAAEIALLRHDKAK